MPINIIVAPPSAIPRIPFALVMAGDCKRGGVSHKARTHASVTGRQYNIVRAEGCRHCQSGAQRLGLLPPAAASAARRSLGGHFILAAVLPDGLGWARYGNVPRS